MTEAAAPEGSGLFLDLDGTLADSLSVMRRVYERFLAHQGRQGSQTEFDRLNGPPLDTVIAILARTHGLTPPLEALRTLYRALIDEAYSEVAPREGALELIEEARRRGYAIAVVTSNGRSLTERWLALTGLSPLIGGLVTGEDVAAGKPDPEPYLRALSLMRCRADISLAIEDSPAGAASAVAAGLPTLLLSVGEAPPPLTAIARFTDALPHLRAPAGAA